MSDTFDHETDAMESRIQADEQGLYDEYAGKSPAPIPRSAKDNITLNYTDVKHQTKSAILFKSKEGEFWVPRSVIIPPTPGAVIVPHWFNVDYLEEN